MYCVNLIKVELNVDVSSAERDVFFNLRVAYETINVVDYTYNNMLYYAMRACVCMHVMCVIRSTYSVIRPVCPSHIAHMQTNIQTELL